MKRKPTAKPVSYRLTEEARTTLAQLAQEQGISMTAVLELLIRDGQRVLPHRVRVVQVPQDEPEPISVRAFLQPSD